MRSFHAASVNVAVLEPDVAFMHHPDKVLQIIDIVQDAGRKSPQGVTLIALRR